MGTHTRVFISKCVCVHVCGGTVSVYPCVWFDVLYQLRELRECVLYSLHMFRQSLENCGPTLVAPKPRIRDGGEANTKASLYLAWPANRRFSQAPVYRELPFSFMAMVRVNPPVNKETELLYKGSLHLHLFLFFQRQASLQ